MSDAVDPLAVAWLVSQALADLGVMHTIGGSLAASFAGEPRATIDIDVKVDLFVAGGTPLDAQQLARRRPVDVGGGRMLPIHPPEDILLQKLRWYQMGGRSSDRQWRDIQGIIRVQGSRLDRDYLREHAPAFGIETLLADALQESD